MLDAQTTAISTSKSASRRACDGKHYLHDVYKSVKLKVNEKSAVAKPSQRKFLGFSFYYRKEAMRRIAPQALLPCKTKVRLLTRRTRGEKLEAIVKELSLYLIGWRNCFGVSQTPKVLHKLDQWIRRRLRSLIWKRWKTGKARYRELRGRGLSEHQAARAACTKSPWRASSRAALYAAFPNDFFKELGLPNLLVPSG